MTDNCSIVSFSFVAFYQNAHRARKGVWGFPQNVKSQKSVCRVPANWLIDLFIFVSGAPLANLARAQVGLALGEGETLLF